MDLLILNRGARVSRDNEGFVVTSTEGRRRIPAAVVSSLTIGRSVTLTSDALFMAVERGIPVVLIERSGAPVGRVWSAAYGSISSIRKGQLEFTRGKEAVQWIKQTLSRKIANQLALLSILSPLTRAAEATDPNAEAQRIDQARQAAQKRMEKMKANIDDANADRVADIAPSLRGWEGSASKAYFEAVNLYLPASYRFERRSQHPALDVANAMLNYAYGMLYAPRRGRAHHRRDRPLHRHPPPRRLRQARPRLRRH